jgi:hypothetical protein
MSLAIGSIVPDTQAPAFRSVGAFCLQAAITRGGQAASDHLPTFATVLVDRFHETNRIGRMELKPTDLVLAGSGAPPAQ